jgi:hypothetical protein
MHALLSALLHFALTAGDPHWTCELAHRDPGVRGTMYLYCAQTAPDGVEIATVGRFVPDARTK